MTEKENPNRVRRFFREIFSDESKAEAKAIAHIAWPVSLLTVFEVLLQFITIIFCGHLGREVLAGITLAASYVSVSAVAVGNGLGTAVDTLVSQSFGANNKLRVGVIVQRAFLIFGITCLPIWGLWLNAENLTNYVVTDKIAAKIAGDFMDIYIPALPAIFTFTILSKYMENQEIVKPLIFVGLFTTIMSVTYNAVLVYGIGLGVRGAAVAGLMSNFTLALSTLVVIWRMGLYKPTWSGWSRECLLEWGLFYKLAIPGLIMYCVEWWTFQAGTFIVSSLGDVALSVQGIMVQLVTITAMIPFGISVAVSVRVGIHLGEGNPQKGRFAAKLGFHLTWVFALILSICFIACRNLIGYAFTSDPDVVELIAKVSIIYFGFVSVLDWLQVVGQGMVRGCGYQRTGAIINVTGYVFIALPIGVLLMFSAHMGVAGYWLGICAGPVFQCFCYVILALKTDWEEQSNLARKRAGVTSDIAPLLSNSINDRSFVIGEDGIIRRNSGALPGPGVRRITASYGSVSIEMSGGSIRELFTSSGRRKVPMPISPTVSGLNALSKPVEITKFIIISRALIVAVAFTTFLIGLGFRLAR